VRVRFAAGDAFIIPPCCGTFHTSAEQILADFPDSLNVASTVTRRRSFGLGHYSVYKCDRRSVAV